MNPRSAAPPTVVVLLLTLLLALGGCGGSSSSSSSSTSSGNGIASKSPEQIVAAAKQTAIQARTVHVAGSIVSDNKPISLDMELVAGHGGKGKLTIDFLPVRLVQIDKAVYINGSAGFYKHVAGDAAAQLLQGKWLKTSASSSDFRELTQLTDLGKLIDATLSSHGEKLSVTGTSTIKGQKAVGITDEIRGGTLYVAATGQPYPLEIVKKGSEGGTVTFDRWNSPVKLTPPAGALDLSELQKGQ
jgi:hypothetical protein